MFSLLRQRQADLVERMDAEDADPNQLEQTYADFYVLNRLISQWNRVYTKYIRPQAEETQRQGRVFTIIDVGCGGGDIAFFLYKWLKKDGINAHITGVDIDDRAIAWAKANRIMLADSEQINQHIHLEKINHFLNECAALGTRVICNDLERSSLAYTLFSVCFPLRYRSSFIYEDGRISLKKSFRKDELKALSPTGWKVQKLFPFRLLLTYEATS